MITYVMLGEKYYCKTNKKASFIYLDFCINGIKLSTFMPMN